MDTFDHAATAALADLSPTQLRQLAGHVESGSSIGAITHTMGVEVLDVLQAARRDGVAPVVAAAYLRGLAAGVAHAEAAQTVEVVWSGPSSPRVPVRSTAQVITDLVGGARRELILVTYSARPYPPIIDALRLAVERGVDVVIVVETLQGAGGLLTGREPAGAFTAVVGARLFHWPRELRGHDGARMHAKLAVADRFALFVSSVNLTQSAVEHSIEAGVLVRGGTAPARAAEHLDELRSHGILRTL